MPKYQELTAAICNAVDFAGLLVIYASESRDDGSAAAFVFGQLDKHLQQAEPLLPVLYQDLRGHHTTPPDPINDVAGVSYHELGFNLSAKVRADAEAGRQVWTKGADSFEAKWSMIRGLLAGWQKPFDPDWLKRMIRHESAIGERQHSKPTSLAPMSHEEIEAKTRQLCADQGRPFLDKTAKQWAEEIGCSESAARKTTLWKNNMAASGRGRARRDKGAKPPKHTQAVTLSPKVEVQAGEGGRHAVLDKLIADQKAAELADETGQNQKLL